MKLLLDENLSRRLLSRLTDAFDGSTHVTAAGLEQATDRDVWAYARRHDYAVVSKDSDFNDLAFVHGPPPKVVWLRVGNASTDTIAALINTAADTIARFCARRTRRRADTPSSDGSPITPPATASPWRG